MQDPDGKRQPTSRTLSRLVQGQTPLAAALLSTISALALWGCQSTTEQSGAESPLVGSSGIVDVERNDLTAALSHVQERFEIAIVDTINYPDGDVEYQLVTIRNEPVWIRFHLPPSDPYAMTTGSVTVRFGRFRQPKQEEAIIRTLQDRLRWLEQRD